MIDRYTLPEMGHIWDFQNKFDIWREIEVLACEAQAELGQCGITKEEAKWIREHAAADAARIAAIAGAMVCGGVTLSLLFTFAAVNKFVNMKSNKIHLY